MFTAACACGFTTSNELQTWVDRAMRIHSCEKWVAKLAGQRRRAARMAAVDRTPKPCHHKQANHEHGTRACYVLDRCRCIPCSKGNSVAEIARERQKVYGRYDKYVSAARARTHCLHLMDQGMGLKQIAKQPGIAQGTLWKLVYGKRRADGTQVASKRILRTTEEAILAIGLTLASGARVEGTGTRRRLQALHAIGYPMAFLGRELHITNIHRTVHGYDGGLVLKATADNTVELYDRLSMTPNNPLEWRDKIAASRSRTYAKSHRWLPPLAWDDDQIDDPTHVPVVEQGEGDGFDEALVVRRLAGDRTGRLTKADRFEIVARARDLGWSLLDIERRAGVIRAERYLPEKRDVA